MKKSPSATAVRMAISLAATAWWPGIAVAQSASAPAEPPTGSARVALPADDSLYQALGGEPGVRRLVDDFVPRFSQHPRFAAQFAQTKMQRFHDTLVQQICVVSGGPCTYRGDPMDEVHKGLKIDRADFNAVVEILQNSMDAQRVPFRVQGQLLARLAPMHGDIVTR